MAEDLVTKAELASQLAELKVDLRGELSEVKMELYERIEKVETNLLREFRKYAIASEARLRIAEAVGSGLMERMAAIEERVGELERGRPLH